MAAGIAWFLAQAVLDHPQPVFAPTATVVALAANVAGRGGQAVEMLVGIGVGASQVALAAGAAMLAVAFVMASLLPLIQAGSSAVLIVALQRVALVAEGVSPAASDVLQAAEDDEPGAAASKTAASAEGG